MAKAKRGKPRRWRPLWPALAAGLAAMHASRGPASGQEVGCPNGRIGEIVIDNASVFDLEETPASRWLTWAYRLANTLHVPTREGLIRRELLFDVGDCYVAEELLDTERMLRAFGFIANAEVTAEPMSGGLIRVNVATQDEWSTRVQPKVESEARVELQGIELAEDNLLGTGRHFSLFYEEVDDQREYGASYITPQFLRTRTDMGLTLARTEAGEIIQQSITYPFVGEQGQFAFRQTVGRVDRFFEIRRPGGSTELDRLWLPVRREHAELAAGVRGGSDRYHQTILAAAVAAERVTYPGPTLFPDSAGRPAAPLELFDSPWEPLSNVRVIGLLGRRNVSFVRRRGFDTVNGVEDIQLGLEADVSAGVTLPGLSEDEFASFAGRVSWADEPIQEMTWGAKIASEMRRALVGEPDKISDVLVEADVWGYLRLVPDGRHTLVGSISAVGAWDSRVPLQLTLGGETGLRGFPRYVDAGGRRLVASLEHRAYLGWPVPDLFDLGTVTFLDVGKIWEGDVPFGEDSPWRATAGVGIRASLPPGSRQTLRVDIGVPLLSGVESGVVFSVGMGQAIGRRVRRADPQLARSANYGLATSDFLFAY